MQARVTEGLLAVPAFQQRLWAAAHPSVQQPLGAILCSSSCFRPPCITRAHRQCMRWRSLEGWMYLETPSVKGRGRSAW